MVNAGKDDALDDASSGTNEVDPGSDPFAPRPGRTLTWVNVSLSVKDVSSGRKDGGDNDNNNKTILDSVSGRMGPRQLTAILGHSGAGKTSLLNVLAGKVVSSRETTVKRTMTLDNVKIDPSSIAVKRKIAFVAQKDTLLSTATAREAIRFSARLRLDKNVTDDEIDALVDRILKELRLDHVADSITGGENFRSLSGGEMRRLSLGIELVVRPSILFCDEVTSGLDSHSAAAVMEVLKRVANCGASVLLTIHQPNSKVFNLIDHLILVNRGRCMYQGSVRDIPQYFSMRGFEVPVNYNPADWILEVSQVNSMEALTDAGFFAGEEDKVVASQALGTDQLPSQALSTDQLASQALSTDQSAIESNDDEDNSGFFTARPSSFMVSLRRSSIMSIMMPSSRLSIFDTLEASKRVSLWTEVKVQIRRDVQKLMRDSRAQTLRFMMVVVGSAIISVAFLGTGNDSMESSSTFLSHIGAMFFLIMANMTVVQLTMLDQIETRPLFVREFETDHFRMLSFGVAKITIEALVSLLQVITVMLIVYWGIGLEGRWWYWVAVLYAYTMIMTSIGIALASYTKDARNAKELIPMTLLPQILFCGFFVSLETVPSFLQWLQWVFPLTYTFRLILNEEFSFCLEREEEQEAAERCVQSLLNTIVNPGGNGNQHEALYPADSVLRLPQTGTYRGPRDIGEYYGLFALDGSNASSLVVDSCALEGTMKFKFNGITANGACDLTVADVTQGKPNPNLAREEFQSVAFTQYVYGQRIHFTHTDDLQSVDIQTHDIYFPEEFIGGFVVGAYDEARMVMDICTTLRDQCPESWALDGHKNFDDCVTRMESLPLSTINTRGLEVADANSTSCRILHGNLAKVNQDHCPHISFFPEPDHNDEIKCSAGYDETFSDFFSEEDLAFFKEAGLAVNLGEKQLVYGLSVNETLPCRHSQQDRLVELEASLPKEYATVKVCADYLETQNATGENNGQYWATLAAMFVVLRATGLYLMRNLVAKNKVA